MDAPREPLSARIVVAIQKLADSRGETQTSLSQKSSVTQPQISRLYSGLAPLKVDELHAICKALEVSILDVIRDALEA